MRPSVTLVELCAGSAAVSRRFVDPLSRSAVPYQGSKQEYADSILELMGLSAGGYLPGDRIVLVELGPWADAYALWRHPEGRAAVTAALLRWQDEPPKALWQRLKRAPVPADPIARVAVWAVLQSWNWGMKAIVPIAGIWQSSQWYGNMTPGAGGFGGDRNPSIAKIATKISALPDLSMLEVHQADARTLPPIPGAFCVLDPDYKDTTGYGFSMPRPDVIETARRWWGAGSRVGVCERESVGIEGWAVHRLRRVRGWGKTPEVLTLSPVVASLDGGYVSP